MVEPQAIGQSTLIQVKSCLDENILAYLNWWAFLFKITIFAL